MHIDTITETLKKHYTCKDIDSYIDSITYDISRTKKCGYYNIIACADTETSSFYQNSDKKAIMYIWQLSINGVVFIGRTWDEFIFAVKELSYKLETNSKTRMIIWFHNLSYDFQFFRKYFHYEKVFSLKHRSVIYAITDLGIEFRDSYILSGMGLSMLGENLVNHKIKKLSGDLDYNVIRTPLTELTDTEMGYCINDVQVMTAYILEQLDIYGNFNSIPLTNTGRVREFVKDACQGGDKYYNYRKIIDELTLDTETYNDLKRAFSGGFTHAAHKYSGKIVKDVYSIDFTSSYPTVLLSEEFPMSKFKKIKIENTEDFYSKIKTYACVFNATFYGIKEKFLYEHYISKSQCWSCKKPKEDNGRIVSAEEISITITELDFWIIYQSYDWDKVIISNMKIAKKGRLPKPIIESILHFYQSKTELKDIDSKKSEYQLQKGMLNSIYGMMVTDIVMDSITYEDDTWGIKKADIAKQISDYNKSKNRVLYYPWGVWTALYAKRNLWTGILSIGKDYVYSDTDSIKFKNYDDHKSYIENYNKMIWNKMILSSQYYGLDINLYSPVNKYGKHKPIGLWDNETSECNYSKFKTLGAKRYIYIQNNEYHLTCSGINKINGLKFLIDYYKNKNVDPLDVFQKGLRIPPEWKGKLTGKLTHTYIDDKIEGDIEDYKGVKYHYTELSAVHMKSSEYKLSIPDNYLDYIKGDINEI